MSKKNTKKETAKFEKNLNNSWAKLLVKETKEFQKYYASLHEMLYNKFEIKFPAYTTLNDKVDFLQELMDEILEANHKMKNEFNISELTEKQETHLKSLHRFFEIEMQNLFSMKSSKAEAKKETTIRDFFTEKVGDELIEKLQEEFKDETGKQMAIVIHLLKEKGWIEIDNDNKNKQTGKSRIFFVRHFTENHEIKEISSINKFLDVDEKLITTGEKDTQYNRMKERLEKIIKPETSC